MQKIPIEEAKQIAYEAGIWAIDIERNRELKPSDVEFKNKFDNWIGDRLEMTVSHPSIDTPSDIQNCLMAVATGKVKCDMDYPNFRKIQVEIIGIDLTNIHFRPIHVRVLEKGLKREIEELEDVPSFGYGDEPQQHLVKKNISYTEDWVSVKWLSNYS